MFTSRSEAYQFEELYPRAAEDIVLSQHFQAFKNIVWNVRCFLFEAVVVLFKDFISGVLFLVFFLF